MILVEKRPGTNKELEMVQVAERGGCVPDAGEVH